MLALSAVLEAAMARSQYRSSINASLSSARCCNSANKGDSSGCLSKRMACTRKWQKQLITGVGASATRPTANRRICDQACGY